MEHGSNSAVGGVAHRCMSPHLKLVEKGATKPQFNCNLPI